MSKLVLRKYPGFSKYAISDCGQVWNLISKKQISTSPCRLGYIRVWITSDQKERKVFSVHRLVGELFVKGKTGLKNEINHLNGIKDDNRAVNLEWTTRSRNLKHAYKTGLHKGKSKTLRNKAILDLLDLGYTQNALSDIFEVSQANISQVLKRVRSL